MDPFYYHGFWGFHFFGLLLAFLFGLFVGRRLAWRRIWRAGHYPPGAAYACGPYYGPGQPPAAPAAPPAGTAPAPSTEDPRVPR